VWDESCGLVFLAFQNIYSHILISQHTARSNQSINQSKGIMTKELQDIIRGRKSRPLHPGEVILDILEDLEITQTRFADILGVSRRTVNEIVKGRRPVTVDMAIRIGKALGNGPQLWLNLQQKVDIWDALKTYNEEYSKVSTVA
jgi:antitoxin HigA-1